MRIGKGLLAVVLSAAILAGIFAGYSYYQAESVKPVFTATEVTGTAENGSWTSPTITP